MNCTGDASQTQGCNNDECPLDCQYEARGSVAIILLRESPALNRFAAVGVTYCFLMLFAHRRKPYFELLQLRESNGMIWDDAQITYR